MKNTIFLMLLTLSLISCKETSAKQDETPKQEQRAQEDNFGIVIHGGAGTILKENMTPELEQAYKAKLEEAIRIGYEILKNGGSSLDAVEKTINVLEDSPLFNAGKGAVFTNEGKNELDASFMDGATLNAPK